MTPSAPNERVAGSAALTRGGGERKRATILFVDIVGSSRLVAGQDPEDADDILMSVLEPVAAIIQGHGGTVSQILGDGAMALFGAPSAIEDHALRACLAAKAIETFRAPEGSAAGSVRFRIGIDSGEILTETLSTGQWSDCRAVGEVVHFAAKLEQSAEAGTVLITERTAALIPLALSLQDAGTYEIAPGSRTRFYRLLDISPVRRTTCSPAATAAFVGREPAVEAMQEHLDAVLTGAGRVVAITGEAGVGKSRLAAEILARAGSRAVVIEAAQLSVRQPTWPRPLCAIARALFAVDPRDDDPRARLQADLARLGLGAEDLPGVLDLLDLPAGEPAPADGDARTRADVAARRLADLLLRRSRERPLILFVDDLQWADPEVLAVLAAVADRAAEAPILAVVTARAELERGPDPPWRTWRNVAELPLQPLSRAESLLLLDRLLGVGQSLFGLKDLLFRRTQGNPLFLDECVRALKESGALRRGGDAWHLIRPLGTLAVSDSVHGLLAARIDSLPAEVKRTLKTASVVGPVFDRSLLAEIVEVPRDALAEHLSTLEDRGFVYRSRQVPNVEYAFRHALLQEVAYGLLPRKRRPGLHARLTEAIERRTVEELPARADLLAYHAYRSGDWGRALACCRDAAWIALDRSRHQDAALLFEQALEALKQGGGQDQDAERARLLHGAARALFPLGAKPLVRERLETAETLARGRHEHGHLAAIVSTRAFFEWVYGDLPVAYRKAEEALAMARTAGDPALVVPILARLGSIAGDRGDYARCANVLKRAIKLIPANDRTNCYGLPVIAAVGCRRSLCRALSELGDFEAAFRWGQEAVTIADETGHPFSRLLAYLDLGAALMRRGEFARARPLLEFGHAQSRTVRSDFIFPFGCAALGSTLVALGETAEGVRLLETAEREMSSQELTGPTPWILSWAAEAMLSLGEHGRAAAYAERSIDAATRTGARGVEGWARLLRGAAIAAGASEPRPIQGDARSSIAIALDIGRTQRMAPLVARCELVLADHAPADRGDRLEDAALRLRDLGMTHWLAGTEAAEAQGEADAGPAEPAAGIIPGVAVRRSRRGRG